MRLRWLLAPGVLLAMAAAVHAADLTVRFEPVGVYNMVEGPPRALEDQAVVDVPMPISLTGGGNAQRVKATLWAEDLFGKPAGSKAAFTVDVPGDGKPVRHEAHLALPVGFYTITGEFKAGGQAVRRQMSLGVVPPHHEGLRPDSFFASNTSSVRVGDELRLLQMVGMKVQRTHFMPRVVGKPPEPSAGTALAVNFDELDKRFGESKKAGLWVLPIVGYSFEGTTSDLGKALGMYGPPRNFQEFVGTWEPVVRRYPDITTWEIWNEPWIFGWTWADTPRHYCDLQKMWCEMALKINPRLRILAGNSSMFAEDNIEVYPDAWKGLIQGTTHHPYSGAGERTMRTGAQARSIDHGMMVTRRMGLPYYYLTEGGTEWKEGTGPEASNNNVNAAKIVQYAVRSALCGAFQTNIQWGIGYGPQWTRPNVTLAVLAYMTEDRPIVADIWPEGELIFGAIFANPRHVTDAVRALPRAAEFAPRWSVPVPPERADDKTKVAVVFSNTGRSNRELDAGGTLTISDVRGLRAFDCTGRELKSSWGRLTVPLTEYPVYIVTDDLDVAVLRSRIAAAKIENVTPVNLYALSLSQPADRAQTLQVRIENQMNRPVKGTLTLAIGARSRAAEAKFEIPPAKLVEVPIAWPGAAASPQNEYAVTLTARTDAGTVERRQAIGLARFARKTIAVDGSLDDWAGAVPVLLDSDRLATGIDLTQYLLNPNLERLTGTPGKKRIVARVYTAYDDANVYVAAKVNEDELACPAGKPIVKQSRTSKEPVTLPYKEAMPDGLNHIRYAGDCLMLAFGFRDRVPGWGRQLDDPYAWKGQFYDTDYHYVAHVSAEGDQLLRQWGADTPRRTAYQTEPRAGYGPVPGAKIVIKRSEQEKVTIYEMSIPRRELALFDRAAGRCRFGFILCNNEKLGLQGGLQWSEAAGVFDHWHSSGSFAPSWCAMLPCQTFFAIEK